MVRCVENVNHFQSVCKQAPQQSRQSIHLVGEVPDDGESDDSVYQLEYIETVQHSETTKFFTKLHVLDETGSPTIECQLDTGATCNIITFDDLCNIKLHGDPLLEPTTAKLKLYDGTIMAVLGEYNLQCSHKGEPHRLNFKIIPGNQKPLLSGETCSKMGLITINDVNQVVSETPREALIEEYEDVFQGLRLLAGRVPH